MTNDEAKGNAVHYRPWIGEHTRPACGSLRLATTNFDLWEVRERGGRLLQRPRRARCPEDRAATLRRDAIGQCVGMKSSMLTQLVPRTIWFGSLRDSGFLTRGKVFP